MTDLQTAERMIRYLSGRRVEVVAVIKRRPEMERPAVLFLAPKKCHPRDRPGRPVNLHYPDKDGHPLCNHPHWMPSHWEQREVGQEEIDRRTVCDRCATLRSRYTDHP